MKIHIPSLLIAFFSLFGLAFTFSVYIIDPEVGQMLDQATIAPTGNFSLRAMRIPLGVIFVVASFISWVNWPDKLSKGQ
ncbi:hypothetical protein [Vibrio vulnificus]|uniref:hypothetical protein n=1 Tax=Vibrio vulnificus TaxID=672 RepID=UPI0011AFA9F2|nr:hypothetical protein [Vibrio vulnificus]